ncbi:MAG: hypothetical protein WC601_10350 [Desulfotomaculaceae bacterium]
MRMSIPAYVSLGIGIIFVAFTFAVSRDTRFLLTALPMILVLLAVPLGLGAMNRRHTDKVDIGDYKYFKIKDLSSMRAGEPVRIRGTIESASLKWLNRPNFRINDGTGEIGVFMFWAPREDIKPGDKVEAAGSLRVGYTKKQNIWGIKMAKMTSGTKIK